MHVFNNLFQIVLINSLHVCNLYVSQTLYCLGNGTCFPSILPPKLAFSFAVLFQNVSFFSYVLNRQKYLIN